MNHPREMLRQADRAGGDGEQHRPMSRYEKDEWRASCPPPSPCTVATPQEERNHYFRERERIKALNLQYDPVYREAYELAMAEREF